MKLKCDELLSNFAFKFNLRRYILDLVIVVVPEPADLPMPSRPETPYSPRLSDGGEECIDTKEGKP